MESLHALKRPGTVELLVVDVSSSESILAAAKTVDSTHGRLDSLVNNAGISGVPGISLAEQMAVCFQTNATGPQLMGDAFAPLLKKANFTPRIVNVSSGLGSIVSRLDVSAEGHVIKAPQYRASKAALNMITACQKVDFEGDGFKVFAYCPGFTVSNLGPYNKAEHGAKPTSEGARPIVGILKGERDEESGCFLKVKGSYENW